MTKTKIENSQIENSRTEIGAWIEMDDRTSYRVEPDSSVLVSSTDDVDTADAQTIAESLGQRLGGVFKPSYDWTPAENGTAVATFRRVGTATAAAKFGYEVRTRDGWSADAAGTQDTSNCFATREEAEPGIPALAKVLGINPDDIRVTDLNNPRHDSVS